MSNFIEEFSLCVKRKNIYQRKKIYHMETIGDRFKKIRAELGLSQKALGQIVGKQWYQIKDLESGKVKNVSLQFAKFLENRFKVNSEWLLTGRGKMFLDQAEVLPFVRIGQQEQQTDTDPEIAAVMRWLETFPGGLPSDIKTGIMDYVFKRKIAGMQQKKAAEEPAPAAPDDSAKKNGTDAMGI